MKKEFLKSMPKLNHDVKIGFVLNDFTNLRDDELSLLIKLKYDKYIVLYTWRNVCFVQQAKSGQLTSNLLFKKSHFLGKQA